MNDRFIEATEPVSIRLEVGGQVRQSFATNLWTSALDRCRLVE